MISVKKAFEPLEDLGIFASSYSGSTQTAATKVAQAPAATPTAASSATPDYSGWSYGVIDQGGYYEVGESVGYQMPSVFGYIGPNGEKSYGMPAGYEDYWRAKAEADPSLWTFGYTPTITETTPATYEGGRVEFTYENPDPFMWNIGNSGIGQNTNPNSSGVKFSEDNDTLYFRTGATVRPGGRPWYQVATLGGAFSALSGIGMNLGYSMATTDMLSQMQGWDSIDLDTSFKPVEVAPTLYAIKDKSGEIRLVSTMTGVDAKTGHDQNIALPQDGYTYGIIPYADASKIGLGNRDSVSGGVTLLPKELNLQNIDKWLRYTSHEPGSEDKSFGEMALTAIAIGAAIYLGGAGLGLMGGEAGAAGAAAASGAAGAGAGSLGIAELGLVANAATAGTAIAGGIDAALLGGAAAAGAGVGAGALGWGAAEEAAALGIGGVGEAGAVAGTAGAAGAVTGAETAVAGVEGVASQAATTAYTEAINAGYSTTVAAQAADVASGLIGSGMSVADAVASGLETAASTAATGSVGAGGEIVGGGGALTVDAGGVTGAVSGGVTASDVLKTVNDVRKVVKAVNTLDSILNGADPIDKALQTRAAGSSGLPFQAASRGVGFSPSGQVLDKSRLFAGLPAGGLVGNQMRRG